MAHPPDPPAHPSRHRSRLRGAGGRGAGRAGAIRTRALRQGAVRVRARPVRARALRAVGAALLAVLLCSPPGTGAPSAASAGVDAPSTPVPYVPEWSWPLAPVPEVLRPFEKPPQKWKRGHRGVDLAAGVGGVGGVGIDGVGGVDGSVWVVSPADGVVSFAGTVVDRGVLSIDHGNGRVSSFEPVSTDLSRGKHVARGQVVASLAPLPDGTGWRHCGRPCLHWGVREDGEYVDPLSFVTDRRPSVLLPLDDGRRGGGT